MNWDAIGAIAELLGAVAVIISIIYLAAQVRQTRLQLQAQAEDNITSSAFEAYSQPYEGDNVIVFRKGLSVHQYLQEYGDQSLREGANAVHAPSYAI